MIDTFFKELRLVLAKELGARIQPSDLAIGAVVMQKINEDFIPELEEELAGEDDQRKQDNLRQVIELWRKYGDQRNKLSEKWNTIAAHEIANVFWGSDTVAEDVAQEIAVMAIERDWLKRFDPKDGPKKLEAYWRRIMYNQTRNQQAKFRDMPSSIDDEGFDEGQIETYSELEKLINRETRIDLGRYVHQRAKYDVQRDMYDMWQELALEKGATSVSRKDDIFPTLRETYGIKDTRLKGHWKKVRELIIDYFKEELGIVLPTRVERKLFRSGSEDMSVADRVAVQRYRRLLAAWFLAPLAEVMDA